MIPCLGLVRSILSQSIEMIAGLVFLMNSVISLGK